MTRFGLILRNLRYYSAANTAIVAGVAVATAVLSGALLVGDCVRGSLADLAVQRLGRVDAVLVSPRFFNQALADRIIAEPQFKQDFESCQPAIVLKGAATTDQIHVAHVQIAAIGGDLSKVASGRCVVNGELSSASGSLEIGSHLNLSLPKASDLPRDSIMARRAYQDATADLQTQVGAVERDPGFFSLFNLAGGQRNPRNAWVNFHDLQQAVGQSRQANSLFVVAKPHDISGSSAVQLNRMLRDAARLDDYGLRIVAAPGGIQASLISSSTYIPPGVDSIADAAAQSAHTPLTRVSAYMANIVAKIDGTSSNSGQAIHYAIVAGISRLDDRSLARDEVAVNEWTARQLNLRQGDRIRLTYYRRQANGDLIEVASDRPGLEMIFTVKPILPMAGLGADPTLTPQYPGLTDIRTMAEWEPPVGLSINRKLITPEDEAYWSQYQAAPKLFINYDTALRLWGSAFGQATSLRVDSSQADEFARQLLTRIDPASVGLRFQPIRAQQLAAAAGATDFGQLFLAFSFFLIVAAALLVAVLFRLNIEQRARQLGLLAAIGFRPRTLRRLAIGEGLLLATIGVAIGSGAAVGYTALIMHGLRTWWIDAVGTTALHLYVNAGTLLIGGASSLIVAMLAIAWSVWIVGQTEPARLLAGAWGHERDRDSNKGGWLSPSTFAILSLLIGLILLFLGLTDRIAAQTGSLAGGSLLLLSGLLFLAAWLRPLASSHALIGWDRCGADAKASATPGKASRRALPLRSIAMLSLRNASRHRSRSVWMASLVALATFSLVIVAAMRQLAPLNTRDRASGTGGYSLILQADVPLLGDLNTSAGREVLGISNRQTQAWSTAHFTSLRIFSGQDMSCLNLTQPKAPTLLAAPDDLIDRAAFTFSWSIDPTEKNPWRLLRRNGDNDDDIPVIADEESATYILKLGHGQRLTIVDQAGRSQTLHLVATLAGSIFQGELLMGEANFRRLFPDVSGFGIVLVDVPPENATQAKATLLEQLNGYGVTVESTGDRLADYQRIGNAYLATFQLLGSLGLLLGTFGLAVVQLRTLIERRAELAMLWAIGFSLRTRLRLVLLENAMLLVAGLLIGSICAVLAVMPTILTSARQIHFASLALTLSLVLFTGLLMLAVAMLVGGRKIKPADLRRE